MSYMTADDSLTAELKRGGKFRIGFKASLFCVKRLVNAFDLPDLITKICPSSIKGIRIQRKIEPAIGNRCN